MRIITIKKGTPYFQLETDVMAALSGTTGDRILDKENCLKHDIEVHFIRKRKGDGWTMTTKKPNSPTTKQPLCPCGHSESIHTEVGCLGEGGLCECKKFKEPNQTA